MFAYFRVLLKHSNRTHTTEINLNALLEYSHIIFAITNSTAVHFIQRPVTTQAVQVYHKTGTFELPISNHISVNC